MLYTHVQNMTMILILQNRIRTTTMTSLELDSVIIIRIDWQRKRLAEACGENRFKFVIIFVYWFLHRHTLNCFV